MRRSAELSGLSRDHHQALAAALGLRRAAPESLGEALARFGTFWEEHGLAHFALEEAVLVPGVLEGDAEWAAGVRRMRTEHDELRGRVGALGGLSGAAQLEAAREVGQRLDAHVRFEERELFPVLEDRLSGARLAELGRRLGA